MKLKTLAPLALVAASAAVQAQDTATTGTATYDIPVGTRLEYVTKGTMKATGAFEREQQANIKSRFTVLDKRSEGHTVLAELDVAGNESTGSAEAKFEPAARFTFLLPPEGAEPGESFQTAGLSGSPFPGWRVEDLFPQVPSESNTSMSLPVAALDDVLQVSRTVAKNGQEITITTVAPSSATSDGGGVQAYSEEVLFSGADKSVKSTSTTLVAIMAMPTGQKGQLQLGSSTEQANTSMLEKAAVDALKKDVEAAVPISARLRSLSAQDAGSMGAAVTMLDDYLKQHPQGSFAPLYQGIRDRIGMMTSLQENAGKIKEGEKAPEFEVTTIDGKKIKLSDYAGKVVLLDFWATWCGPCVMELPNVKALYEKQKGKNFEIIGLSADHELSDLQEFVTEKQITWPNVFEPEATSGTAMLTYGITKYPTTVLVDAKGMIRHVDLRGEELDKAVDDLLKGQ